MKATRNGDKGMTSVLEATQVTSDSSSTLGNLHRQLQQPIPATTLDDLLYIGELRQEILTRVPAKKLFSLTIVCKRWRTMIKDPYLIRCLKPRRNPAAIFVKRWMQYGSFEFTRISLDGVSGYGRGDSRGIILNVPLKIVAKGENEDGLQVINHSSNGLFICSSTNPVNYARRFYLYNPTTKQSNEIPRPFQDSVIAMNLAFEAPKIYKIIAVCRSKGGEYSLKVFAPSRSILLWRNVKVNFPDITTNDKVLYEYGVYVSGSLYWPHCVSTGLLFFNMHEEKLVWQQDIPQPHSSHSTLAYFGECRGHLLMIRYRAMRGGILDVLELRHDPTIWYIKYQVDLKVEVPYFTGPVYVLAIVPGEEEEDDGESYLIIHIFGKVLSYNFKHQSVRLLYDLDLQDFKMDAMRSQSWKYVHSYSETLLHPKLPSS
ncbi:F-box domain-containing protein [Heracleum sosnowskyi]|uniref:F-box domain-containing protein n=1 Tax=Heracleum sosnowskyi TaxID=360622 RepID=A0AAD8IT20_9APIA|nr:F-box domain-containing protein [Heracleum sosnowskyi]